MSAPRQVATDSAPQNFKSSPREENKVLSIGRLNRPQATGSSQWLDDGAPLEEKLESFLKQIRRSGKGQIPWMRYQEPKYIMLTKKVKPKSSQEPISHLDKEKWLQVMQNEMKALENIWVFKLEKDGNGKVVKHNA